MKPTGLIILILTATSGISMADEAFFESRIRPLLIDQCYSCHSTQSGKSKSGLKLDSRVDILKGGDSGPAAAPGKPAESLMIKAILRKDKIVAAMPPEKELSAAQIKDIEKWIEQGMVFPGNKALADPMKHWAFQPVGKFEAPQVKDASWPRNTIDRFLLAKMEQASLKPMGDAPSHAVARRLSFALTGLPPSPADLLAITVGDATAIEKYADQLLTSPQFGERWAVHWMDLVRYADSAGQEYDYEIEGAWRYRDHLVRAFNADLPFDQFIREQIAGDTLPPRTVDGRNESALATAWWHLQEQATAPVDLANDEADRLDNMIDVMGKAFTGLTVGCARCHDHKFDPIRTREYYGLFGIAASSPGVRTWANGAALEEHATRLRQLRDQVDAKREKPASIALPKLEVVKSILLVDFALGAPQDWLVKGHTEIIDGGNAALRGLQPGLWSGTLSRKLPASIRSPQFLIEHDHVDVLVSGQDATVQVVVANYQMIRDPIYNNLRKRIESDQPKWVRIDVGRWRGKRAHIEIFTGKVDGQSRIMNTKDTAKNQFGLRSVVLSSGKPPPMPEMLKLEKPVEDFAKAAGEIEKQIPAPERFIGMSDAIGRDVPVYARGDANKPRPTLEPRSPLAVFAAQPTPAIGGSNRMRLADAIASPNNPLTARVMVNRIWHHLFGRGIVGTVDNFGHLGDAPTHPELLDHLAHRFVHVHGWSTKKMIREIVLSRAFQMQSGPPVDSDPSNKLLSRFPMRRLDAEAIRDSILAVAGTLDATLGGPAIPVPHNLAGTGTDSGNNTPASGPVDGERRRSIYLATRRNFPSEFLEVFDKPAPINTFGRRDVSNVPTQALALLNDPFVTGQSRAWAKNIRGVVAADEARIERMFILAFSRRPDRAEMESALALIKSGDRGYEDLAMVLYNAREFIHVP